jgi:hypothetical protein
MNPSTSKNVLYGTVAAILVFAALSSARPFHAVNADPMPTGIYQRYSLHELRNGNMITTALLDGETGHVWSLATNSDPKDPTVNASEFERLCVLSRDPDPQDVAACKLGDLVNLQITADTKPTSAP